MGAPEAMPREKKKGRNDGCRATPSKCKPDSNRLPRVRSLIVGAALALQRFDAAVLAAALALGGWPR